jgi:hypothetical protein
MNAIAFTREVRSAAQLRRWLARLEGWEPAVRVAILRDAAQKARLLRMTPVCAAV